MFGDSDQESKGSILNQDGQAIPSGIMLRMATPWYSQSQLLVNISSALNQDDVTQLAPRWNQIAQDALDDAQSELESFLNSLGFVQSQIDAWDTMPKTAAHRRLGLYFALVNGNPLGTYPTGFLEALDPRKMLREAGSLEIATVATAPVAGESQVGGINSGGGVAGTLNHTLRQFRRISGERGCW